MRRGLCRGARLRWLLGFLLAVAAMRVFAADPQPYRVRFAGTGNSSLDKTLKASSQLESLRTSSTVSPFALIARARQDVDRLESVLHSFGYYDGRIGVAIDGHPLDDPALGERLLALPDGQDAEISVSAALGPLYRIGRITLEGSFPADARSKLGVEPGAPAVASEVLAARDRVLNGLQEEGYALARIEAPVADLDPSAHLVNVTLEGDAGPRVEIGDISFTGLENVHEGILRRRLLVHTGERYSAGEIERARQDLLSLGVFSGITARVGDRVDDRGRIPLVFEVRERPRHALGLNLNYSTDLGGSFGTTWSHRNLFGNAEQLNLSATAINIGGSASTGLGYNTAAQFIKPDFLRRDQSLQLNLAALRQSLQAYDQTSTTGGVALNRKLTSTWSASIGLSAETERILQEGVTRHYTLFGMPLVARYDNTGLANPFADPTRGIRGALTVTPTVSVSNSNSYFVVIQNNAAVYFDLARLGWTDPGRSVVAARALVGAAVGANQFQLPPDQRFYAGGSTTVRGYRYQSLGPQFADGNPIGGTSVDAASIEFRQRIGSDFGMALFVDGGHVSGNGMPFQGTPHTGAGIGFRYYTPIGAIRLDAAVPLNRIPGGDSFEIYVGIGQAF